MDSEKKMKEKKSNQKNNIKLPLLLITILLITSSQLLPTPTISFNSTLFQIAITSLGFLLFWIAAYSFIKPKKQPMITSH
jgi:uncharacterized membrane protein